MTGCGRVRRGEYHRQPDPAWDSYPTYLAKLEYVIRSLDKCPDRSRVLDATDAVRSMAGCPGLGVAAVRTGSCGIGVVVVVYARLVNPVDEDAAFPLTLSQSGTRTSLPRGRR